LLLGSETLDHNRRQQPADRARLGVPVRERAWQECAGDGQGERSCGALLWRAFLAGERSSPRAGEECLQLLSPWGEAAGVCENGGSQAHISLHTRRNGRLLTIPIGLMSHDCAVRGINRSPRILIDKHARQPDGEEQISAHDRRLFRLCWRAVVHPRSYIERRNIRGGRSTDHCRSARGSAEISRSI